MMMMIVQFCFYYCSRKRCPLEDMSLQSDILPWIRAKQSALVLNTARLAKQTIPIYFCLFEFTKLNRHANYYNTNAATNNEDKDILFQQSIIFLSIFFTRLGSHLLFSRLPDMWVIRVSLYSFNLLSNSIHDVSRLYQLLKLNK